MASRVTTLLLAAVMACMAAIGAPAAHAVGLDRRPAVVFAVRDRQPDQRQAEDFKPAQVAPVSPVAIAAVPAIADFEQPIHPARFQRPPPFSFER